MTILLRGTIVITFLLVRIFVLTGQDFEGVIHLHVTTDEIENDLVVTVKGDKILREVVIDSSEQVKIITDFSSQTSTLLRRKNDLKYGLISDYIPDTSFERELLEDENLDITTEMTDEMQLIDQHSCVKYLLKSAIYEAEAWVVKDHDSSISKYFPEFINTNSDPGQYKLRIAADAEGLILRYNEKEIKSGKINIVEISFLNQELGNDVFSIDSEYVVLNKSQMRQLYIDSRKDESKKKEWDEFYQLFGHEKH